jgi:hypothetical protein
MNYVAEPVGDVYANQLMQMVGAHVRQHVAAQFGLLQAEIDALRIEVETQNAEMATLRCALAAIDLQKNIDSQAAEMAALRGELAALHSRGDASEATAAALRAEIAAVGKSIPQYVGVWREGDVFPKHSLVSFRGSMWIATEDTAKRPGSGDGCNWQLCVKAGRDARSEQRTNSGTAEPRK